MGLNLKMEKILRTKRQLERKSLSEGLTNRERSLLTEIKSSLKEACHNQAQIEESYCLFIFCAINNLEERINQYVDQSGYINKKESMLKYIAKLPCKLEWAKMQAYIALGFGMAAAMELNIASCPMEGFKPEEISKVLKLDDNLKPCEFVYNYQQKLLERYYNSVNPLNKRGSMTWNDVIDLAQWGEENQISESNGDKLFGIFNQIIDRHKPTNICSFCPNESAEFRYKEKVS